MRKVRLNSEINFIQLSSCGKPVRVNGHGSSDLYGPSLYPDRVSFEIKLIYRAVKSGVSPEIPGLTPDLISLITNFI
jgi:hypothetical protein